MDQKVSSSFNQAENLQAELAEKIIALQHVVNAKNENAEDVKEKLTALINNVSFASVALTHLYVRQTAKEKAKNNVLLYAGNAKDNLEELRGMAKNAIQDQKKFDDMAFVLDRTVHIVGPS